MEFLRKWWQQIAAFVNKASFEQKALLALIVVVMLIGIIWVVDWAGAPVMVPILPVPPDRQAQVKARLEAAGIRVESKGTQMLVPTDRQNDAMAILVENDLLSGDASAAWDQMIGQQTIFDSNSKTAQRLLLAKQKVLSQIISKMAGVRRAEAVLSMPDHQGFGSTAVRPSAAVNLVMQGDQVVNKHLVEAVAGMISGAVAGMRPADVVVIDANRGRQFTVKSADDMTAGDDLEKIQAQEQYTRDKIAEVLSYIPGVIVAVNVRNDAVLAKTVQSITYGKDGPVSSEYTKDHDSSSASPGGGEAGVRPNVGLSIEGAGGGNRTTDHTSEARTEYHDPPITSRTDTRELGKTQKISVTVNVPRTFFVSIYKRGKTGDTTDPDDDKLKPIVDDELVQIQDQVKPLVSAEVEGVVSVHMIPDATLAMFGPAGESRSSLVNFGMNDDLVRMASLGGLALLALGLVVVLTRWATKQPQLPSVEEMAGVPAQLPAEDDVVGEADAHDPAMAGVELDEKQIRSRKIAEQIGEMVNANPAEAATLFSRWIRKED